MFTPKKFRLPRPEAIRRFIKLYNFATVLSVMEGNLQFSYLPLVLDESVGPYGVLRGHMARANPHWKIFDGSTEVRCIFQGPHAYISPRWYSREGAVPTWNYAVVHAIGSPTIIRDERRILSDMDSMTYAADETLSGPASSAYMSRSKREALAKHVVGFELVISRIEGKFKLGQNRSIIDQEGIVAGLRREVSEDLADRFALLMFNPDLTDGSGGSSLEQTGDKKSGRDGGAAGVADEGASARV